MFERTVFGAVTLKPFEVWHANEFAEHLVRAIDRIRPWVGPAFVTQSVDAARATLQRYAAANAQDGARIYGLWDGGKLIGGIMFVTFDPDWGICEIGCWLEPAAEGRGLMGRSIDILLEWAFTARGMKRVEWRCRTDNLRSIAVAQRAGMKPEGVLRSSWVFDGHRYDKEVFSILQQEWQQTR